MENKPFTFEISLNILNHLGRNLYRNFTTILGEAISNSWDADAKNVWIEICPNHTNFSIKDDGCGMDKESFQNKFLKIGYSKRKEGQCVSKFNRPFIGRKGIGKLALLSCAKKIHILSKTDERNITGGVIDNAKLDVAIQEDQTPQEYCLGQVDKKLMQVHMKDVKHGTLIYFEEVNSKIYNTIEYIKQLVALYFRFSLIAKDSDTFTIYVNGEEITMDTLQKLYEDTQFVWNINKTTDPYIDKIMRDSTDKFQIPLSSNLNIKGFIASVKKPENLKIRGVDEKVTLDLYVNGRIREKDILKHIPTTQIAENYIYGQIYYDDLDGEKDIFTTSREGIIADDPTFKKSLEDLQDMIKKQILPKWDELRISLRQDGDIENTKHLSRVDRKLTEALNLVVQEFSSSTQVKKKAPVDKWVRSLEKSAVFNMHAYTECFIVENLLRKYIVDQQVVLTQKEEDLIQDYKAKEEKAKGIANISFDIRQENGLFTKLSYLPMKNLVELVDQYKGNNNEESIARTEKEYKPLRDAIAHMGQLGNTAQQHLKVVVTNIKTRLKKLLE